MIYVAALIYAIALVLANVSIATWGPGVAWINALVLIGLDLALRDWLHLKLDRLEMLGLICASAMLTLFLSPGSGQIAAASAAAFGSAALVDWAVFSRTRGPWFVRSNASNAAGAVVDSLVFSLAAGIPLAYAPSMVVAKIAGGFLWAALITRLAR